MGDFTLANIDTVKDSAAEMGFGDTGEARFARESVDAVDTGFSLHRLKPGKRQAFGHQHEAAEEVYVVIGGSGRAKLGEEIVELTHLDALRVAPPVPRAFEGGDDGMELLVFGPHVPKDGKVLPGWWED